jgi:hypothetical protein
MTATLTPQVKDTSYQTSGFLQAEDLGFILQENGGRLIIDSALIDKTLTPQPKPTINNLSPQVKA